MKGFDIYSINYPEAEKNPDLLEKISGLTRSVVVLRLEFAITNKGSSVIVSGNQHTIACRKMLGQVFENWVTETADSVGTCEVIQNASAKLHEIFISEFMKGGQY